MKARLVQRAVRQEKKEEVKKVEEKREDDKSEEARRMHLSDRSCSCLRAEAGAEQHQEQAQQGSPAACAEGDKILVQAVRLRHQVTRYHLLQKSPDRQSQEHR